MILRSLSERLNDSFSTDERFKSPRTNIFFRRTYIFAIYLYVAFLTPDKAG